ncbi:4Fe-4S dicluster domain-containing protein [Trichlorobacter ammonificans]|uniref:Type cbb3 cytochrome oxidase biogenesis protein CcoG, involved in Cu oxidation n=1 Tax=Trichlorobacter ammonificans TaxID=2916410 RepID=A0ABM9D946_9BACT|nr:4Fe-4S dicluster domain-containing protein [Trichlorobacter ammonificans]CAH2031748.1 Type cbb3 cytochrome oxidase biogenesis protein CcoG, involved in Cu oxidation [Trichlorobacter ammonificans]
MESVVRIAPYRKLVQWLSTLLLLLVPFLQVGGESLLRLDAASRTLHVFGAALRIEEFYLFLLVTLLLVFLFLFVTMMFGRVWCGWLCPQTTLSDLAEFLTRQSGRLLPGTLLPRLTCQLLFLILAFLVGANLVWYFIPPAEFLERLLSGRLGMVAGISLAGTMLLVYLDLALVRRTFCTTVCPYGRIQVMAMDRNTLTLEMNPARKAECIRCGACVRACPTGIDIRDGLQIECINCGRCRDACQAVMEKRGTTSLIHYTFGTMAQGGGRPLNLRSLVLGGLVLALCAALAAGVLTRREATLKVRRNDTVQAQRMPDGRLLNFVTVFIENRSRHAAVYDLSAALPEGAVDLLGPSNVRLAANDNRRVDLILRVDGALPQGSTVRLLLQRQGTTVAVATLTILEP